MSDYGHDLLFGIGLAPNARDTEAILATADLADELGLDMIGIQDHPYQPAFLDTWTLLSYVAARTTRLRLFPDVLNVPMRPPAVLARSAAALDILSGGRVELGLGAGYFLDPMVAMGVPSRTRGELVDALGEAIDVIRALWSTAPSATLQGRHYSLAGARPGPPAPHPIAIWLGAYKRRMLELTGRAADGWIPSLGYAAPDELERMSAAIDAAAEWAGRAPAAIRRGYNVAGRFASGGSGFLQAPTRTWAEQLTGLALGAGISAFVLSVAPGAEADVRRWVEEVAPAVREAVAAHRERAPETRLPQPRTPALDTASHAAHEAERLAGEREDQLAVGREGQQTLLAIHNHLRQELAQLRHVIGEVKDGRAGAQEARTYLNSMTMRQNYWTLGAFCAAYCRVVSIHHSIEDQSLFPDLKAADQSLGPVLARLREEHEAIADVLRDVDAALVAMVEDESRLDSTDAAVTHLSDALLAHLRYEEDQLLGPIGRLAIRV